MDNKRISILVPADTHRRLKLAAASRGESVSDVLRRHIDSYVHTYAVRDVVSVECEHGMPLAFCTECASNDG